MKRVHFVGPRNFQGWRRTVCGRWALYTSMYKYEDHEGATFQAMKINWNRVTCSRCLRDRETFETIQRSKK